MRCIGDDPLLTLTNEFLFTGWNHIFVAGIYHGEGKPKDVNVFLSAFRDEIVAIKSNGIFFQGHTIRVAINGMSCDAPATAFILNIKKHNAFNGSHKCTTKGEWTPTICKRTHLRSGGRVTYREMHAPLRSDQSFRDRHDLNHHS